MPRTYSVETVVGRDRLDARHRGEDGFDSLEPPVELTEVLDRRRFGVRLFNSRRERSTNVLVIAAVTTVRKPIPKNITSTARNRPPTVVGTLSPYPTVVVVWTAHQSPSPSDG